MGLQTTIPQGTGGAIGCYPIGDKKPLDEVYIPIITAWFPTQRPAEEITTTRKSQEGDPSLSFGHKITVLPMDPSRPGPLSQGGRI